MAAQAAMRGACQAAGRILISLAQPFHCHLSLHASSALICCTLHVAFCSERANGNMDLIAQMTPWSVLSMQHMSHPAMPPASAGLAAHSRIAWQMLHSACCTLQVHL